MNIRIATITPELQSTVVHEPLKPHQRWIVTLAALLVRGLASSLRWRIRFASPLTKVDEPLIFALWHNQQLLMPMVYHWLFDYGLSRKAHALVSQHSDGKLAANLLEKLGVGAIAGSSTRGGRRAFIEMIRLLKGGENVAITPDGPRGPIYKVKDGAVKLAQLSGRPIYPLTLSAKWCIRFNSWDKIVLPLPFSRVNAFVGDPIYIPHDLDDSTMEAARTKIEEALTHLTQRAGDFSSKG